MDQNPNQSQPERNWQNPADGSGQPGIPQQPSYGPPTGDPPYPPYGPPAGGPQYPPYGPPTGDPQYPPYPPYGPPAGGPQYPPYPPYGPPVGGPQYPPYPYALYNQAQPPKKGSKVWLWVLLAVVGVSLIACIASCIIASTTFVPLFSSSIQDEEATATAVATPANNDNVSAANVQAVSIGQTVTLQNVACTLTSVKPIAGAGTATPQAGDEFIVVDIKLTNLSKQTQQYDSFDFYVVNSTGNATLSLSSDQVPQAYKQQLYGGLLTPGQTVEGKLVFEVASSDHQQTLNWQPNLNVSPQSSSVAAWKLGL